MEIIIQKHGSYDDPTKVSEERFDCKMARRSGNQYIFTMPNGHPYKVPALDSYDVTVVMPDGTLKPVK